MEIFGREFSKCHDTIINEKVYFGHLIFEVFSFFFKKYTKINLWKKLVWVGVNLCPSESFPSQKKE